MSKKHDKIAKKKVVRDRKLLEAYGDPEEPGSLGGVGRFAASHKIPYGEAKKLLEKDLGTLSTDPDVVVKFLRYPLWYSA